ncbi:hypothetical protein RhiJN_09309 [Ceratobasidium sp. AG-Ba]|nr:hypothetical protein RhiJN_09309 [Ceratobasidium sp. AG-Ba]
MRAFTMISALFAVAVTNVSATPGVSPASLLARQATAVPDIPKECQASCATVQKITTCGADLACMCTKEIGQGIVDCGTCGIKYHSSDPNINEYMAQFQASVNSFASSCKQAGYDIGTFDVLGGSGSSGGAGTGTGTASTSSPTKAANGAVSLRAGGALVGLAAAAMALVL